MSDLVSTLKMNLQAQPKLTSYKARGPIKAIVIGMLNDHRSTVGVRNVLQSLRNTQSELDPYVMDATVPSSVEHHLSGFNLQLSDWKYLKSSAERWRCPSTGLELSGYNASDWTKVVSCMVSHMRAWQFAIDTREAVVVLEHDAKFERQFVFSDFEDQFTGGVLQLNNPLGATRRSKVFYDKVMEQTRGKETQVVEVPWIDHEHIPQGIAGNSAYIIKPEPAQMLLDKVAEIGIWPNDALMCKQLFPWLQVAYPFYTSLQGIQSTTQG